MGGTEEGAEEAQAEGGAVIVLLGYLALGAAVWLALTDSRS